MRKQRPILKILSVKTEAVKLVLLTFIGITVGVMCSVICFLAILPTLLWAVTIQLPESRGAKCFIKMELSASLETRSSYTTSALSFCQNTLGYGFPLEVNSLYLQYRSRYNLPDIDPEYHGLPEVRGDGGRVHLEAGRPHVGAAAAALGAGQEVVVVAAAAGVVEGGAGVERGVEPPPRHTLITGAYH